MTQDNASQNAVNAAGKNSVLMALKHQPERIFKILIAQELASDKRLKAIQQEAKSLSITVHQVPKAKLDKLTEIPHQGVIAMMSPKPLWDIADLVEYVEKLPPEKPALILALDEVTDPHNFGALIRVAAGAGVDAIVVPKVGSAGFSPVVSKASAGTDMLMTVVVVPNLVDAMERLKKVGLWWAGAAIEPKSVNYDQYDYKGPTGIVLGSEGKGLRRLVSEHCDQWVKIPLEMDVESLNVSVAGGIILFEALRQRRLKKS